MENKAVVPMSETKENKFIFSLNHRLMMISGRFVSVLWMVSILALSCASSPESHLIGKWYNVDTNSAQKKLEFLKDGTLIINDVAICKYRIVDKERMEWNVGAYGGGGEVKLLVKYYVSKNELQLMFPQGVHVFRKAN